MDVVFFGVEVVVNFFKVLVGLEVVVVEVVEDVGMSWILSLSDVIVKDGIVY